MYTSDTTGSDLAVGVIKHGPVLVELRGGPLGREALEGRLGVSNTTAYRYTGWLGERALTERTERGFALTALGEAVAEAVSALEATVRPTAARERDGHEGLLDVVRLAPVLDAFREGPLDRRDLERRLGVSRSTSFRFLRTLDELGFAERSAGTYALTGSGEVVAAAVGTFDDTVRTAFRLGPVLEAVRDTEPALDIDAFADATVRTTERGDAHSPANRFISLVEETTSLRCIDSNAIVPLYISDIQERIVDGLETEDVLTPSVVANILAENPNKCIEACLSGHLTIYLHDDPPYGLAIFDDRVGIGVRGGETRTLQAFVDTDSPAAREWAEAVFESYRAGAVRMEGFGPRGFKAAVESGRLDSVDAVDLAAIPPSARPEDQ